MCHRTLIRPPAWKGTAANLQRVFLCNQTRFKPTHVKLRTVSSDCIVELPSLLKPSYGLEASPKSAIRRLYEGRKGSVD